MFACHECSVSDLLVSCRWCADSDGFDVFPGQKMVDIRVIFNVELRSYAPRGVSVGIAYGD
jgi:hypothetical protein